MKHRPNLLVIVWSLQCTVKAICCYNLITIINYFWPSYFYAASAINSHNKNRKSIRGAKCPTYIIGSAKSFKLEHNSFVHILFYCTKLNLHLQLWHAYLSPLIFYPIFCRTSLFLLAFCMQNEEVGKYILQISALRVLCALCRRYVWAAVLNNVQHEN